MILAFFNSSIMKLVWNFIDGNFSFTFLQILELLIEIFVFNSTFGFGFCVIMSLFIFVVVGDMKL